ncbi:MAG: nitrilase-related carbon-nitrogen hydrolase, partial [Collinsella sp.]
AAERGVRALVVPELNLTGYTAADLFHNRTLLHACEAALVHILDETRELPIVFTIGLPVAVAENIYNCAAVCCAGELLGLTAKKYLPNYGEFYERRWFVPAPADPVWVEFAGQGPVPLGSGLVYRCCDEGAEDLVLGVEVCEDLWVPAPPSTEMALAGATVILNPSASDEIIGKADYRRSLISNQSARLYCAYAYADASEGESTTDMVFAGENLVYENGSKLPPRSSHLRYGGADVDLDRLVASAVARRRGRARTMRRRPRPLSFRLRACWPEEPVLRDASISTAFSPRAFVPADHGDLAERCETILDLQTAGLKTRLAHTGTKARHRPFGRLDSTLALLVTVRAFDALGLPRTGITAVSMPGFGTTHRTKSNAESLARDLG